MKYKHLFDKVEVFTKHAKNSLYKTARTIAEPTISDLPPQQKSNLTFLMYNLNHYNQNLDGVNNQKGRYSNLINSILAATDMKTLQSVLTTAMNLYDLEAQIIEFAAPLAKASNKVSSKSSYQAINSFIQKALYYMVDSSLKIDGVLGPLTQAALNKVKQQNGLTTNDQAIQSVLAAFKAKYPGLQESVNQDAGKESVVVDPTIA